MIWRIQTYVRQYLSCWESQYSQKEVQDTMQEPGHGAMPPGTGYMSRMGSLLSVICLLH